MNFGESTLGLNGYPCNSGLIIHDTKSQASLGLALSHPLLCHLLDSHTFEMMLTRSLHNNDLKGLTSRRNIDTTFS